MYNNRHWATDVVAGAAVGVLTGAALIRYVYSHHTTLDEWLLPAAEPSGSAVALRRAAGLPLRISLSYPAF
jgi:membrane-associated phospholipid phosphatase